MGFERYTLPAAFALGISLIGTSAQSLPAPDLNSQRQGSMNIILRAADAKREGLKSGIDGIVWKVDGNVSSPHEAHEDNDDFGIAISARRDLYEAIEKLGSDTTLTGMVDSTSFYAGKIYAVDYRGNGIDEVSVFPQNYNSNTGNRGNNAILSGILVRPDDNLMKRLAGEFESSVLAAFTEQYLTGKVEDTTLGNFHTAHDRLVSHLTKKNIPTS